MGFLRLWSFLVHVQLHALVLLWCFGQRAVSCSPHGLPLPCSWGNERSFCCSSLCQMCDGYRIYCSQPLRCSSCWYAKRNADRIFSYTQEPFFLLSHFAGKATLIVGGLSLLPFVVMSLWSIPRLNFRWLRFPAPRPVNWSKMISVLLWNTSG